MSTQPETMAEWVARWRRIGPELERERAHLFATANLAETIAAFDRPWRLSLITHPPSPESGLIEQQRLFQRLRNE